MNHHSQRDPDGNLRYPQEHTLEDQAAKLSTLPKSQQFADTRATLGIASRGFAFTGMTTDNQGHDRVIHSSKSLLYDPRQSNELFVEDRSGTQARPAFLGGQVSVQTSGPNPDATAFTASQSAPTKSGTVPALGLSSWWDRIKANFRAGSNTQSTNLGTKPPEKFQIGLRSSNVKPAKADQKFPNGPGPVGPSSGSVPMGWVGSAGGVIGNVSR